MAYIRMPEAGEAEGSLKTLYEEALAANGGRLPAVKQVLGVYPEALRAIGVQDDAIRNGGSTLGRRREEMLATLAAAGHRSEYFVVRHGEALREAGGDDRLVFHLQRDHSRAEVDSRERAMLDFAAKLNLSPGDMEQDDVSLLREVGFGDREILDIVMIVAHVNFMVRIAGGLGLEPEENFLEARRKAEQRLAID